MPFRALLVAAFACACHSNARPSRDRLRVQARLEQVDAARFRLSLRLSRAVTRLPFTRPGDGDRLRSFRMLEPASARLIADGGDEAVVGPAPFDEAMLELPVHRHLPEKDYAPFFPLSGGGVFVYTGQLDVGDHESTDVEYEFVPLPGEFASMPGRLAHGPLRWTAAREGTYVAFGRAPPVDEPRFIAVIDGGFPPWLREEARALLPRLFEYFAAALRQELPERPAVLLSYGNAEQAGTMSLKGGTLPGLLQQDVQLGNARRGTSDQGVLSDFRHSLAHESAHLWNSRLAHNRGPDWVHEGGADLLAFRALRALGLLSAEGLAARLSWAASECALHRGTGALAADRVRARYACGAIVQAVASAGPGIEAVWAALLARARAVGSYDEAMFFAACEQAGARAAALEFARQLASAGDGGASDRVAAALRAGGFGVREGIAPADFQRAASRAGRADARWLAVAASEAPDRSPAEPPR